MFKRSAMAAVALVVVTWATVGYGGQPQSVATLTEEEAKRPAEEWTLKQVLAKGWTPYDCAPGGGRAIEGRRWPNNDPNAASLGTCVSYSFMPAGVVMEPGEGLCTWPLALVAGATTPAQAVTNATATWAGVADIHFTLVGDGGGNFNVGGAAGLRGNIRVGASNIPRVTVLAHGYYPPPNGVSQAGDVHFDNSANHPWSTAAVPPPGAFDLETVALHELGHALGLTHAGTVAGDVMFWAYNGMKRNFATSVTDIGFMTGIYGAAPHNAQCTGACCHSSKVCSDDTQATCIANGYSWRGPGTRCPTGSNVRTAMHASGPVTHWTDPSLNCYNITRGVTSGCIPGVPIDSWSSSETQPTCHNFGQFPESPPIPADFFEPGSDPFYGDVCLKGEPLGPTEFGEYGEADTLIRRTEDPFDRCELPPAGEQRMVEIEIVALNLKSIGPITVMVMGQPTLWDMAVDLSVVPLPPGMSQLIAMKEHCNGGTYFSYLNVQPRFTFTKLSGPGIPPGSQVQLDTGLEGYPPIMLMQEDNPPWTHDVDPYLNLASEGEGCTEFHPGIQDANPQTDCDCNGNLYRDDCDISECDGSLWCSDCNANGIPDECDPDSDGDGIPDDCDACPDVPGMCVPCVATDARSLRFHGANELSVTLGVSGGIDPRLGGIVKLEIDVDDAGGFGGGVTVNCSQSGDLSGTVSATSATLNTVTVEFSAALPDGEACIVRLDCNAEVCVIGLEGDTDGNSVVATTDAGIIKPRFGDTADNTNARFDVDGNGIIATTDFGVVKPKFGNAADPCP